MPRNAINNILFYKEFSETLSEKSVINGIFQGFGQPVKSCGWIIMLHGAR
jgi:hypothetical protein